MIRIGRRGELTRKKIPHVQERSSQVKLAGSFGSGFDIARSLVGVELEGESLKYGRRMTDRREAYGNRER